MAFSQLEKNSLNTEIEAGRDMITLGIYPDPKDADTIYINGAVMSDTALYAVAATDFISGGDTGYSNLMPPDVLPAYRVSDFARPQIREIAGTVCKEIAPPPGGASLCADMSLGPAYFDPISQTPSDATAGFSTAQHWRTSPRNFIMPRQPYPSSEEAVQQRPFLSLKLENFDFSESGIFINHYTVTTQNFAGISNPLLANKGTQAIGADHKLRLIYDFRVGTVYALSDSSFSYTSVPGTPPALAYNVLGSELGGTFRLPVRRNRLGLKRETPRILERPSWLSFQYSLRYEHQLIPPVSMPETLTPTPSASGQSPLPSPLVSDVFLQPSKLNTIYGRSGLRAESGDTYLEIGVEGIRSGGVPLEYTLTPSSGPSYYCSPVSLLCGVNSSLQSGSDLTPIAMLALPGMAPLNAGLSQAAFLNPGAYLNFYLKFPIWSRRDANRTDQSFYFTLTNKGDLYFNPAAAAAAQTRYLDKLTPALSFPLWNGLSLTPKVDFILYENMINRYHYRSIQPAVSLSYTFAWREGMTWIRALKYGAQTTVPSPAGATH